MFSHYLKIAMRNIRKFALQNTVSVIGLAAGFVCLCLSSVWLYYENSFDRFHKDADRIYTLNYATELGKDFTLSETGNQAIQSMGRDMDAEQTTYFRFNTGIESYREIQVDSVFCDFFGIELLKGDWSFIGNSANVALSDDFAQKTFKDKDPLGEKLDGRTVVAIMKGFSKPSVIKFDVLSYREVIYDLDINSMPRYLMLSNMSSMIQSCCFWKLKEGADPVEAFQMLRNSDDPITKLNISLYDLTAESYGLTSIKKVHLNKIMSSSYVSYRTMSLFCMASILILVCSLVNILIFFINTLRGRNREAALRVVHGASMKDLIMMFTLEMSMLVIAGLLVGIMLVWVLKEPYIRLVDISMPSGFLMISSLVLLTVVLLCSILACVISVYLMRRRSLKDSIADSRSNGLFRKLSVSLQLFTGTLFATITCIMLHQFSFLRNENWGLNVKDQAVLTLSPSGAIAPLEIFAGGISVGSDEELSDLIDRMNVMSNTNYQELYENQYGITGKLESLPMVTQVMNGVGDYYSIVNSGLLNAELSCSINDIDSCAYNTLSMLDKKGLDVLKLTVIDGEIPTDRPILDNEVVITENLSRKLGLGPVSDGNVITVERTVKDNPFEINAPKEKNNFNVIAVVKDVHAATFGSECLNLIICTPDNPKLSSKVVGQMSELLVKPNAVFLVRFKEGYKKEFMKSVSEMLDQLDCEYEISFTEDKFFVALEKDKHLKNLILALGVICIIISIFGVWSMISLACQERRREIAVRKVHGAKIKDILSIFTKEYGLVVVISMALAFITGYLIMHKWIQQFPRQAAMSWWIFAGIFAATVLVICITVIHKVLKTARENPADVIKSE